LIERLLSYRGHADRHAVDGVSLLRRRHDDLVQRASISVGGCRIGGPRHYRDECRGNCVESEEQQGGSAVRRQAPDQFHLAPLFFIHEGCTAPGPIAGGLLHILHVDFILRNNKIALVSACLR